MSLHDCRSCGRKSFVSDRLQRGVLIEEIAVSFAHLLVGRA